MKLRTQMLSAVAAAGLALTINQPVQANDVSGVYVGVGSASSEYWAAFINGAEAVAGSLDLEVNVLVSDFDGQKLLEQFGAVFTAGCEGCAIALDPASNAFTRAIVQRADAAGAKIVNLWNRPDGIHPWDTAPESWVANISFDGVDSGYRNGMALCEALDGEGGIVALQGIPDNPPAKQRLSGLEKAIEDCPGLNLLDVQVGNWDQSQGQSITRSWLARYGDELDGIFSANDGMALGAVAALREQGLEGQIPVTGSDGSTDVLSLIESGEMLSTMYINGYVQGATAVALAIAAVKGDIDLDTLTPEQRDFYLSQTLATTETVDDILGQTMDDSEFTYEKMKEDFWKFSVGQIPEGANL